MKAALRTFHLGRILAQVLAIVLLTAAIGGVASTVSMRRSLSAAPDPTRTPPAVPRTHAPGRPIVAIVLGDTQSDVTDVLGPYALFSEAGGYDVNLVASSRAVRTLTGGLEVAPQLTFAELAALSPRGPELVITPAITEIGGPQNSAVREFVRRMHEQSATLFSWCTGAEVLAASGVADGRELTAHWGDIGRLEAAYPRVTWRRGVRYIDGRTLVSTAGLTSGIDATLHVLAQRDGAAVAARVAAALHLPASSFVADPTMAQHLPVARDAIYLFNAAFYWPKQRSGILLFEGVSELALAAFFDAYPASFTDAVTTLAGTPTVVSRHGLTLAARSVTLPPLDRFFVPAGAAADSLPAALRSALRERAVPVWELGDGSGDPFRGVLESLALREGTAVARFAAKRFEYRSPALQLASAPVSPRPFAAALAAWALATAVVIGLSRLLARYRTRRRAA